MANNRTPLPVSVRIASNAETGESFILYRDKDFEEMKQVRLSDIDELFAARVAGGEKAETQERFKAASLAANDAYFDRLKTERDSVLQFSREINFQLVKPTFGEQRRAYADASRIDYDNAQNILDSADYQVRLLIAAMGGDESKVDELEPVIAQELMRRISQVVHPNQKRLPFAVG